MIIANIVYMVFCSKVGFYMADVHAILLPAILSVFSQYPSILYYPPCGIISVLVDSCSRFLPQRPSAFILFPYSIQANVVPRPDYFKYLSVLTSSSQRSSCLTLSTHFYPFHSSLHPHFNPQWPRLNSIVCHTHRTKYLITSSFMDSIK